MKPYHSFFCLLLFHFVANTSQAIPVQSFQLIEKSPLTEMSRKEVEQQLGRKMSLKERAAFWLAKKKGKRKKGLSIFEKILITLLLILILAAIIVLILVDNYFARRDRTPRQIWPSLLLVIDLGLIYFVLSRPTRTKLSKKD